MVLKPGKDPGRGLSLGKVAELCGVTRKTILRWVKEGMLPSFVLPSGHHRVLPKDIELSLRQHGMPVPNGLAGKRKPSVIVADNDADARLLISRLLSDEFEVSEVCNGIETCIALGQNRPDILVLDIRMPKMNGVEVCQAIRQDSHLAGVKIIAISAHLADETYDEISTLADMVIPKPIDTALLVGKCREYAGHAGLEG
ncbi:MAG: response regulator [Planctomycetota bacterium]|jgi:CheY-like chemotaxis protein/predicted DNA-binding transcriptional regulator AlpA